MRPLRVCCFVLAGGAGERLRPLTDTVAKPLLHFGGRHRLLDITLSNVANSRLATAYVLSQYRKEDVADYLGEHWGPSSGFETRYVDLPPLNGTRYRGTADAVLQNLERVTVDSRLILVLSADHIYRMDYRKLLEFHLGHDAGSTVAAIRVPFKSARALGVMSVDSRGRMLDFVEKPEHPAVYAGSDGTEALVSMGIYVFDRGTLLEAFGDLQTLAPGLDFGRDLIPHLVASRNATAYVTGAKDAFSYWSDVGTLESYYESNMELLKAEPPFDLYHPVSWPMHPLTNRAASAESRPWNGSIVSPQALLGECSIERSILSPGVSVEDDARIEGSILLPGARIGRGASVRNAIVDTSAAVQAGDQIGHDAAADRLRFHVTEQGVSIVPARRPKPERIVGAFRGPVAVQGATQGRYRGASSSSVR